MSESNEDVPKKTEAASSAADSAADKEEAPTPEANSDGRRDFLTRASGFGLAGGLILGYGAFAVTAGKFLYPEGGPPQAWLFVRDLAAFKVGDSSTFIDPQGGQIAITRLRGDGTVDDFVALSTVCPHLGCQVHWVSEDSHFFCPCHNGVFDLTGKGIGGPPGKAGQSLPKYPLKIEEGLVYIQVPVADKRSAKLAPTGDAIALAKGRDACLGPQPKRVSLPVVRECPAVKGTDT